MKIIGLWVLIIIVWLIIVIYYMRIKYYFRDKRNLDGIKPKYWAKYGSVKRYVPGLIRNVHFCKKCGEYITKTMGCSNPYCPEPKPDCLKYKDEE